MQLNTLGFIRRDLINTTKNKIALKDRIIDGGWVKPEKLNGYISGADVGIIIYEKEPRNNYYCEPGKLSDYVLSGVPVIAPNYPSIAHIIKNFDVGVLFANNEPKEIANAILEVLKRDKKEWMAAINMAKKKLVWDEQEDKLVNYIVG